MAGILGVIIAVLNGTKKAVRTTINMAVIVIKWFCIVAIVSCLGAMVFIAVTYDSGLPNPLEQSYANNDNHNTHDTISNDVVEAAKAGAEAVFNANQDATTAPTSKPAHLYAPNGKKFPRTAGYVQGYPKLHMDGMSTLTIKNDQNDSAIFGKLIYLGGSKPKAVRHFYIPAWGGLILRDITAGNYDVRYKDLESGIISKTESFDLTEYETEYGSGYSEITMTLYKVSNGNMQTVTIPKNQF